MSIERNVRVGYGFQIEPIAGDNDVYELYDEIWRRISSSHLTDEVEVDYSGNSMSGDTESLTLVVFDSRSSVSFDHYDDSSYKFHQFPLVYETPESFTEFFKLVEDLAKPVTTLPQIVVVGSIS